MSARGDDTSPQTRPDACQGYRTDKLTEAWDKVQSFALVRNAMPICECSSKIGCSHLVSHSKVNRQPTTTDEEGEKVLQPAPPWSTVDDALQAKQHVVYLPAAPTPTLSTTAQPLALTTTPNPPAQLPPVPGIYKKAAEMLQLGSPPLQPPYRQVAGGLQRPGQAATPDFDLTEIQCLQQKALLQPTPAFLQEQTWSLYGGEETEFDNWREKIGCQQEESRSQPELSTTWTDRAAKAIMEADSLMSIYEGWEVTVAVAEVIISEVETVSKLLFYVMLHCELLCEQVRLYNKALVQACINMEEQIFRVSRNEIQRVAVTFSMDLSANISTCNDLHSTATLDFDEDNNEPSWDTPTSMVKTLCVEPAAHSEDVLRMFKELPMGPSAREATPAEAHNSSSSSLYKSLKYHRNLVVFLLSLISDDCLPGVKADTEVDL